jgi:uncharacterized protein (TIGR03382 family)
MKVTWGSVLAISIVATGCSVDPPAVATRSQGIIGGAITDPSKFPATGMLVVAGSLECTATLVAPDVAITAAHCLRDPEFGEFGFTLDTDATDGTDDVVPVKLVHQHPDFDDTATDAIELGVRNDIGVIILEQPMPGVTLEQIDEPAPLASGNKLTMCGYGRTAWYTGDLPLKRDAEVLIDRAEDFEFTTTAADPQPCIGDSGAPLFADGAAGRRIVGVVSRAVGRSRMCDTGAIITRIGPYADWIAKASQDRDTGSCSAGGGGGSALPLVALAVLGLRRRRAR